MGNRRSFTKLNNDEVRYMLTYVTDFRRDNWRNVGMALKLDNYPFEIWEEWSKRDPDDKWKERDSVSQWRSFKRAEGNVTTLGTVIRQAKQNGWRHDAAVPADMSPLTYIERPETKSMPAAEPSTDITDQIQRAQSDLWKNPEALQHFRDRGLTDETIKKFMLGYMPGGLKNAFPGIKEYSEPKYAMVYKYSFPFVEKDRCVYAMFENETRDPRVLEKAKKYLFPAGITKQLYNLFHFQREPLPPAVFITEGVYDALSIEQCGAPAVALGGTSSGALTSALERYNVPNTVRFVIALDNDAYGNSAAEKLGNELIRMGYKSCRYTVSGSRSDGTPVKDANELLQADPDALRKQIKDALNMALSLGKTNRLQGINFKDKELTAIIEELDPLHNPQYTKQDELTAGKLFADTFRSVLRFNTSAKAWSCYNGIVWQMDESSAIAERLAQRFTRMLQLYIVQHKSEEPTETENNYLQFATKLGDRQKRLKMIEDAKPWLTVTETDFDKDNDLLNCQNCVINLQTGRVLEHDPELLLSKVCNVSYYPDADTSAWTTFIAEIMQGDAEKIEYLQRVLSYGMLGSNEEEKCFIFYGKSTRNGKSTLIETIAYLLGDYAKSLPPEALAQKPRDASRPNEEIARLRGVRFVQLSEPSKRMIFDVALLKNLTGGDTQTAHYKYGHMFEYTPVFKVFINTNYLPVVNDDSLFSSERIQVLTFDKHFTPEEQNRSLKRSLRKAEVLSGVLKWLLEGLKRYRVSGVDPVPAVIKATEEYRHDSDKVGKFFEDCCRRDPGRNVTAKALYEAYSMWCQDCGYGCENKGNFLNELRTRGLLSETGTVQGNTARNIVKNYTIIGY